MWNEEEAGYDWHHPRRSIVDLSTASAATSGFRLHNVPRDDLTPPLEERFLTPLLAPPLTTRLQIRKGHARKNLEAP